MYRTLITHIQYIISDYLMGSVLSAFCPYILLSIKSTKMHDSLLMQPLFCDYSLADCASITAMAVILIISLTVLSR